MTEPVYASVNPNIHESMQETARDLVKTPIPRFVAVVPPDGYTVHAVARTDMIVDAFTRHLPNWVYIPGRKPTVCGGVKRVWAHYRFGRDEWDFTKHENERQAWLTNQGKAMQTNSVCPRCTAGVRAALARESADPSSGGVS